MNQFSQTVQSYIISQGTDPEDVIKNAFGCFDEDNVGLIHEDRLRELLTTIGDRFTDDEVGNDLEIIRSNCWVNVSRTAHSSQQGNMSHIQ